ncbi:GMC oxidoreductase [Streptomyces sp. NPDC059837]|uniref:GMC oxidoreductase n=1 Tax=unclassified Streptomyces TaxID=2593676 RepID=UPI0036557B1F
MVSPSTSPRRASSTACSDRCEVGQFVNPGAPAVRAFGQPTPATPPRIDHGCPRAPDDRRFLREVVRTAAELTAPRAFREVSRALLGPDSGTLVDDRALDAWIAGHLGTAHHTRGTAPMGPADDPGPVVDQYGRLHGIAGLRVADTLILPEAPLRGPAATAVLIGERVAHAVRHDLR